MEMVNRGKKILIALIVTALLIDVVVIAITFAIYATNGLYNEALFSLFQGIIRLALSGTLLFFLYKGHGWAKWILVISFFIAGLLALRSQVVNPDVITLLMGLIYICFVLILVISKNVNFFIRYQKGEITDLQIKYCYNDKNKPSC